GSGQLGYGHTDPVADEPIDVGDVSLGEPAQDVAAGTTITCALLESGAVRCWGRFTTRCSGYGDDEEKVGDDEVPSDKEAIEIGSAAAEIRVGGTHMCVLLAGGDGKVRCWGFGVNGALGYGVGSLDCLGDDEFPSARGDVDTGGAVRTVEAYHDSNCVQYEGNE